MKLKAFALLALLSGLAHGAQAVEIAVEVTDVVIDQPRAARWEDAPREQAGELVATAEAAGGDCYEMLAESIVTCYFAAYEPKRAGIDFQALRESLAVP